MKEDLKKLKSEEAAKRPGGRRKGQGEKYDPRASYSDTLKKAMLGKYAGTPFEPIFVAAQRILGLETEENVKLERAELGLELFLIGLYKEKRWSDFLTLHSIFTELEERVQSTKKSKQHPLRSDDNFRQRLLYANSILHFFREMDTHVYEGLRCVGKKKESERIAITKASILKEFRIFSSGLPIDETSDANCYKAMRSMGLPKEPPAAEMAAMIRAFEKADDEWDERAKTRSKEREKYHLLRVQLKAFRDVSI